MAEIEKTIHTLHMVAINLFRLPGGTARAPEFRLGHLQKIMESRYVSGLHTRTPDLDQIVLGGDMQSLIALVVLKWNKTRRV